MLFTGNNQIIRTTSTRSCYFLLMLISLAMFIEIEAQFFTKSNSKSIPRMGRRSELAPNLEQRAELRRQLIDSLLGRTTPSARMEIGEIASLNDQPFDEQQDIYDGPYSAGRNERSENPFAANPWSSNKQFPTNRQHSGISLMGASNGRAPDRD